jgi:hypothetical protein
VEYSRFHLAGPNIAHVVRMERENPAVTLESALALGRVSGGTQTVSNLSSRYNDTINAWGGRWGKRSRVVAAINGSFFDPQTGIANRGIFHSGWYAKRFDDLESGSGFAWKTDRSAFIGGCVAHRPGRQFLTFFPEEKTEPFASLNAPRGENELVIYTPQYAANTGTGDTGVEVLVEMAQPLGLALAPQMTLGYVRQIRKNLGSTPIPFDHIVLSASGTARRRLLNSVRIGQLIGVSQDIRHFQADCREPDPNSWEGVYASIGGSFPYLLDGQIQDFEDPGALNLQPRTAIAYNDEYIFFIVVDGRNPGESLGMTIRELAEFSLGSLGARWAIAQDGGGSSTLVVNGKVMNYPNADLTRAHRNYLPSLFSGEGVGEPAQVEGSGERTVVERGVANGMLMVVLEPLEFSTAFRVYDRVTNIQAAEIRQGPGENYAVLAEIPAGQEGRVRPHLHRLNGVWATGNYWWKVTFGEWTGWMAEPVLSHLVG